MPLKRIVPFDFGQCSLYLDWANRKSLMIVNFPVHPERIEGQTATC